jgi:heptosyltransferase I
LKNHRAPLRVLIVKLSSLGDVVHAMPVVHDILAAHPDALIDWAVEPGFAPMLRRVTGMHEVIECALRRWRSAWWTSQVRNEWRGFLARLHEERYDAVLDLQGLTKSALIARLARCTKQGARYGLANRTDGAGWEPTARWLADRAIRIEPHTHALDRSRELAAQALGYARVGPPVFGLTAAKGRAAGARTVVFVHGSSREDKLWPEERWVELGGRLVADGWRIALPQGSDDEEERALRLAEAMGVAHCDLWPRMNLGLLVDRMGGTQAVVGVDSGPSHVAVALGLPHVQIYNFPTAWRTGPLREHGHAHQVSVGGDGAPSLDEVWAAWQRVTASQPAVLR